ncbi:MAG: hypothetical protein JWN70_3664 [Planctomycetaceae bacterium]|nr:hypothetical protein [Planctomycetaceae bacterium]
MPSKCEIDDSGKRGCVFWMSIALLSSLAIYPLSFGPVAAYVELYGQQLPEEILWLVFIIYDPLIRLYYSESIPVLPQLLEVYCEWWH